MNSPGPAISCSHSSRERPQNEHGQQRPRQQLCAPTPPPPPGRLGGLVDHLVDPLVAQAERLGDRQLLTALAVGRIPITSGWFAAARGR
jgi:hypothetical protein